jgi:AcrR family transcriptional regulator
MARAAPLSSDERRAAIMAATERLIVERGGDVSTAEIAKAAGIAQGTIFRVFATKEAIIDAIFADAFDRNVLRDELTALEPVVDLTERLRLIVKILQRRNRRIMALFHAIGARQPPKLDKTEQRTEWERSIADIAALIEPDRGQLRMAPVEAARLLQGLVIGLSGPLMSSRPDYSAEAIVDLLLNGIARRDAGQADLGSPPC